ncbi:Uncharacterized protein DAT39_008926, partial [Clarias magur]
PVSEPPTDQSQEGGRSRPSPSTVVLMDRPGLDQTRLIEPHCGLLSHTLLT